MEQQIVGWVKGWFDFPAKARGLFVTGSSQANFMVSGTIFPPLFIVKTVLKF